MSVKVAGVFFKKRLRYSSASGPLQQWRGKGPAKLLVVEDGLHPFREGDLLEQREVFAILAGRGARRGGDQHQTVQPIAVLNREERTRPPAHAVAEKIHPVQIHDIEKPEEVVREILNPVGTGRFVRIPVSPLVESEDPKPLGKPIRNRPKREVGVLKPMGKNHGRPLALHQIVQAQPLHSHARHGGAPFH